eukprot:5125886-Ditylum_brightwellii.AAC.1
MYKPPKEGKKDDLYRKDCLINSDKAGCMEGGKSKSKKTMTHMTTMAFTLMPSVVFLYTSFIQGTVLT